MTLKRTPLHKEHLALGAKMGDFAGWEMPFYYGSQIEEHKKVREDAGVFDVSHMNVLDIKGTEAKEYLRYLIANDVEKLKEVGKALYGCMLTEGAGVVDDLMVYRCGDAEYRIVINAATYEKDMKWLKKHAANFQVEIIERSDIAMFAIQGPNAVSKVQQLFNEQRSSAVKNLAHFCGVAVDGWWIARTGYTGEDGYEIMLPAEQAPCFWRRLLEIGVAPCGLVARDSLRLEAGLNLYGAEMDESTSPLESKLGWTISWEPIERDFVGREALEKQKQQGLAKKMVGLVLEDRGMLRKNQKVFLEGSEIGETTSGGFSPTLGKAIALARVLKTIGDYCQVEVRGKKVRAKVVKPVFVRHGKVII